MSELLNIRRLFFDLPENIVKDIRCLFVTNRDKWKFGFYVTNDDQVYAFGKLIPRILNYSKKDNNKIYALNKELCGKHIEEFYEGPSYVLARNDKNQIFRWNWKHCEEANGSNDNPKHLKSQKIDFFDDKDIIEISCGRQHCLALSSYGVLYGWGDNSKGELGMDTKMRNIIDPVLIELNDYIRNNILSIHCTPFKSFVVSEHGQIYKLTENGWLLTEDITEKINKFEESKCESNQKSKQNVTQNKVIGIKFSGSFIVCQTSNAVYEYGIQMNYQDKLRPLKRIEKSVYNNLFEYFLSQRQTTYKTIHLRDNQLFAYNLVTIEGMSGNSFFNKTFEQIFLNDKQYHEKFETKLQIKTKLRNFQHFNYLSKCLESDVKYYYCSGKKKSEQNFALFVMTDNRVFGFGRNKLGKLGFGIRKRVKACTPIPELCGKNIEEFFEGFDCMFARTKNNHIYGWGHNQYGQLARGYKSGLKEYLKPEKIDYFDKKLILDISCGEIHCFALSAYGVLYGWGGNYWGQTGCDNTVRYILKPSEIENDVKFKFIHCFQYNSYAIDIKGEVYFWGKSDMNENIVSHIKSMNAKKILRYCGFSYILTEDGFVYEVDITQNTMKPIESNVRFIDMFNKENRFVLQSDQCVYELDNCGREGVISVKKGDYLNFYEYYLQEIDSIFKTIHITSDGFLMTEEIKLNEKYKQGENKKLLILEKRNVFSRKYETLFEQIKKKGAGGYGEVFEVRHRLDNKHFAIKKIKVKDELNESNMTDILREIKAFSRLKRDFVAKYTTAWIETQVINKQIVNYAYIQMELCSQSLRDVIESMKQISDKKYFQTFIYYISCELFKELTECVDYLHSLTPPIIHRDLKPENVLISGGSDGHLLKLCDFGIAKLHKIADECEDKTNLYKLDDNNEPDTCHTQGKGTSCYMAPEVKKSTFYDLKSDIYSLALIATEIFLFGDRVEKIRIRKNVSFESKYLEKYLNTNLETNYRKLLQTLSICLFSTDFNHRPDCKQLLHGIKNWTIDKNLILTDEKLTKFQSVLTQHENTFLKMFFEQRLK